MAIWLIFITVAGACVGSFLNVVILRLPAGQSLVRPASACPKCGHTLAWFENVPVISWLGLRGRCRTCHAPISGQYPIIEAVTAILFGGLTAWFFLSGYRPVLMGAGLGESWAVLIMHLILIAGLIAATAIDIRHYIIPITIPWLITVIALIGYPLAALGRVLPERLFAVPPPGWLEQVVPMAHGFGIGAAIGGLVGLALALALMRLGYLPRSFDDPEQPADSPPGSPEAMIAHPHPRREVLKEALFLALPIAGMLLGAVLTPTATGLAPLWLRVGMGVVLGYLIGGGLVWLTRVLGTLAFGKEAMGLGDVHLLAGIGAVVGGVDSVFVFFIAPFVGLTLTLAGMVASLMKRAAPRVIPFGPSLAGAAGIMLLFRDPILRFFIVP